VEWRFWCVVRIRDYWTGSQPTKILGRHTAANERTAQTSQQECRRDRHKDVSLGTIVANMPLPCASLLQVARAPTSAPRKRATLSRVRAAMLRQRRRDSAVEQNVTHSALRQRMRLRRGMTEMDRRKSRKSTMPGGAASEKLLIMMRPGKFGIPGSASSDHVTIRVLDFLRACLRPEILAHCPEPVRCCVACFA